MSIYTLPINEITWGNIREFCNEKIAENSALDYKEDFPSNLEKTIAAFANTLGGIIIIGVKEDNENKPTLPVEGIPFDKGLEERVMNIILTNITPPVFPEIKVCTNEDSTKALIVIRVPQSHQTPHAINKNTRVHSRTGNLNNPEDLADVDKILWMTENRKLSENLRKELISKAESRFNKIFAKKKSDAIKRDPEINECDKYCQLTLMISPLYPKEILSTPIQLKNSYPQICVYNNQTTGEFPLNKGQNGITIPYGYILNDCFMGNYIFHAEFNVYGLYLYKQNLFYDYYNKSPQISIRLDELITTLDSFIVSANNLFNILGYHGFVNLSMKIENSCDCKLHPVKNFYRGLNTFEEEIFFENKYLKYNLIENKYDIIFDYIQTVLLAYNVHDWTVEHIKIICEAI